MARPPFHSFDPYAEYRCSCRHLVYWPAETTCRFCKCRSHMTPAARAAALSVSASEESLRQPAPPATTGSAPKAGGGGR